MKRWPSLAALAAVLVAQLLLAGCATTGANPRDPWESYNRSMTRFNDVLDENILEPVAKGYQTVLPDVVRKGVNNFFGNLSDVWSTVNNVLQFKPREAADSLARVGINTTVGLLGVIDVASELDIPRHREDFGQTLGHWGVGTGPYLVLPLLGPSTLRDTAALPLDWKGDLVQSVDGSVGASLSAVRLVDKRANLLTASDMLGKVALDRYAFIRDAYLQRRRGAKEAAQRNAEPEERYDLPEGAAPGSTPP
jgi:phospholipid-binding lipoprotein MlaA